MHRHYLNDLNDDLGQLTTCANAGFTSIMDIDTDTTPSESRFKRKLIIQT